MSVDCPYCAFPNARILFESPAVVVLQENTGGGPVHAVIVPRRHVASYFEATSAEKAALWSALDEIKVRLGVHGGGTGYAVRFETDAAQRTPAHLAIHVVQQSENGTPLDTHQVNDSPSNRPLQLTTGGSSPLGPVLFRDLERAVQVDIAVAFVFVAALNAGVLSRLRDVLAREGSRVRLLTGDYQNVTEPEALRLFLTLREQAHSEQLRGSLELRVFQTAKTGSSFHPKTYLLHSDAHSQALATYVGSSNLSRTGLFEGVEWNLRLADPAAAQMARDNFEKLFTHAATCDVTHEWINVYEARRSVNVAAPLVDVALQEDEPVAVPEPNSVQRAALDALEATREAGNHAGLVVLATGLGKTWLSAFDATPARGFNRVLFVAHRAEILAQAMATFARIQPNAAVGLYTGQDKSSDATLLFASVQTLSQRHHLERFARDHFDYIVVDEFHHAAATTYRRILDHFEPKFMLGLTATPERTDGGDLLALCDENVVYECGLATGVRQDLLSPFDYFGVPDLVEYEQIPWRGRGFDEDALTSAVATTARADNALAQLRQHGGKRVLGFCVSQRHADFMRDYFREHSQLRCASVHSGPSSDSRSFALEQLGNGDIDVLFCVDMFNEGLDVPSIDTVLMLRPTESKVVWLQQLGRGLRKSANKSHLRVIDYIGNHRSFLEKPAALLAALGVTVTSEQQLARLLAERSFELPPGCDVIYDLEALRILEKLCPPSRATLTIREWYEAFRGHAERRPTAREALHSGYKPREVYKDYGSWLEFVREMGDLNEAEQAALLLDRDFLVALETLEWRKSDELVLIDALRATGRLPGSTSVKELSVAYRHRVLRSAALTSDAAVNVNDDEALQLFLRDGPIKTWCSRPTPSRQRWFTFQGDTFASAAGIRCGTQPKQRDAFQSLVAEFVEWRIAEFLSRRPQEAVLEVTRGADGEPLLKLDRKRYDLPTDWVWIVADSAPYQAHYLNHVVSEVRAEGKGNQLGSLLKTWFGEEAGKPGAAHRVVQQRSATGELQWKPQQPAQIVDDAGVEIDATFDCEELEGEPTIVFHSRGGDRNNEYARGLEVLLQRLGSRAVQLTRIAVESGATRALPLEQRTLDVEGFPYPINLSTVESAKRLQTRIGKTAAKVGREPGAKGSGNSTKRLRLWLSQRVDEDQLARGEAR